MQKSMHMKLATSSAPALIARPVSTPLRPLHPQQRAESSLPQCSARDVRGDRDFDRKSGTPSTSGFEYLSNMPSNSNAAAAATVVGILMSGMFMFPSPGMSAEIVSAAASASDAALTAAAAGPDSALMEALKAGTYTPSPMEVGWELWFGFAAGVFPFIIGASEFTKRIVIQQRCQQCSGTGLVASAREGTKYKRKCPQCGGFFPWVSWKQFFAATATPGNGGVLLQPKGQTSIFYTVPPPLEKQAAIAKSLGKKPLVQVAQPVSSVDGAESKQ
eukprot:gene23150-30355_t